MGSSRPLVHARPPLVPAVDVVASARVDAGTVLAGCDPLLHFFRFVLFPDTGRLGVCVGCGTEKSYRDCDGLRGWEAFPFVRIYSPSEGFID